MTNYSGGIYRRRLLLLGVLVALTLLVAEVFARGVTPRDRDRNEKRNFKSTSRRDSPTTGTRRGGNRASNNKNKNKNNNNNNNNKINTINRRGAHKTPVASNRYSLNEIIYFPHDYTLHMALLKKWDMLPENIYYKKTSPQEYYFRTIHNTTSTSIVLFNTLSSESFSVMGLKSLRSFFVQAYDVGELMYETGFDDSFDVHLGYTLISEYRSLSHMQRILEDCIENKWIDQTDSRDPRRLGIQTHARLDASTKLVNVLKFFKCLKVASSSSSSSSSGDFHVFNQDRDEIRRFFHSLLGRSSGHWLSFIPSRCTLMFNASEVFLEDVVFRNTFSQDNDIEASLSRLVCKYLVVLEWQDELSSNDYSTIFIDSSISSISRGNDDDSNDNEIFADLFHNKNRLNRIFKNILQQLLSSMIDTMYRFHNVKDGAVYNKSVTIMKKYVEKTLVPLVYREKLKMKQFYVFEVLDSICETFNISMKTESLNSEINNEVDFVPAASISSSLSSKHTIAKSRQLTTINILNSPIDEGYATTLHDGIFLKKVTASSRITFRSWGNDQLKYRTNLDSALENDSSNIWIYNILFEPKDSFHQGFSAAMYPFSLKYYTDNNNLSSIVDEKDLNHYISSNFTLSLLNKTKDYHSTMHKCYTNVMFVCLNKIKIQAQTGEDLSSNPSLDQLAAPRYILPSTLSKSVLIHTDAESCLLVSNRAAMSVYHYSLIYILSLSGFPFLYDFSRSVMNENNNPLLIGTSINVSFYKPDDNAVNPYDVIKYMKRTRNQEKSGDLILQMYQYGAPLRGKYSDNAPKIQRKFNKFSTTKLSQVIESEPNFLKTTQELFDSTFISHGSNNNDDKEAINAFKDKQVSALLFGLGGGAITSFLLAVFPRIFIDNVEINESVLQAAINLHFTGFCDVLKIKNTFTDKKGDGSVVAHSEFYSIGSDYDMPEPKAGDVCRSKVIINDAATYLRSLARMQPNSEYYRKHYNFIVQDIFGIEVARGQWDGMKRSGRNNANWEDSTRLDNIEMFRNLLVNRKGFGLWHVHEDLTVDTYVRAIAHVFGVENVMFFRTTLNGLVILAGRNVYANKGDDVVVDHHDGGRTAHTYRIHPCINPNHMSDFVSKILSSDTYDLGSNAHRFKYSLDCKCWGAKNWDECISW